MIEARSLTKLFQDKKRGTIRAVDGVSFTCRPGQIYGLLGANGAGKTTTLRLLATLLQPTGGEATVAGFDVRTQPEKVRANTGFLATSTALYGRLTAREPSPTSAGSTVFPPRRSPPARASSPTSSRCTNSSTAAWRNFPPA